MGTSFSKREFEMLFIDYSTEIINIYRTTNYIGEKGFIQYVHYAPDGTKLIKNSVNCEFRRKKLSNNLDNCIFYIKDAHYGSVRKGVYTNHITLLCTANSIRCDHHRNKIYQKINTSKYLVFLTNSCPYRNNMLLKLIKSYYEIKYNIHDGLQTTNDHYQLLNKIKINFIEYLDSIFSKKLFIKFYLKWLIYMFGQQIKTRRSYSVFKMKYLFNTISYLCNTNSCGYNIKQIINFLCNTKFIEGLDYMYKIHLRIYFCLMVYIYKTYAVSDYEYASELVYIVHCSDLFNTYFQNSNLIRYTPNIFDTFYDVRIESPKKVQKNLSFIVYFHKQIDAYIYENPIYMRLYNETFNRINPNSLRFLWCATIARITSKQFIFVYKKLN